MTIRNLSQIILKNREQHFAVSLNASEFEEEYSARNAIATSALGLVVPGRHYRVRLASRIVIRGIASASEGGAEGSSKMSLFG